MPYAIMNEGEHVDGWATWRPSDRRRRERRLPSRSGYVAVRYVGVPQPLPNVEPSSILVPRSSVQRMGTRCAYTGHTPGRATRGQGRGGQRDGKNGGWSHRPSRAVVFGRRVATCARMMGCAGHWPSPEAHGASRTSRVGGAGARHPRRGCRFAEAFALTALYTIHRLISFPLQIYECT